MPGDGNFAAKALISTESPEAKLNEVYESSKSYLAAEELNDFDIKLHYNGDEGVKEYRSAPRYENADDAGKKYSVFQEALTHYGIDQARWFGQDFHALKWSNYDDKRNGYDVVAAVRGADVDGAPMMKAKLGLDLTTGLDQYEEKFKDIAYRVDHHPDAQMKYQFCVDRASSTYGAQKVPQVVVRYGQEELDSLMDAWKNRASDKEAIQKSPLGMRSMVQALIQCSYFGKQIPSGIESQIRRHYILSAQYLKDALESEIVRQGRMPRSTADQLIEMIADIRRCDPESIRQMVVADEHRKRRPLLTRLIRERKA